MSDPTRLTLVQSAVSHAFDGDGGEVILSLRDGMVWVSWPDDRTPVRLGEHDSVVELMANFIRQSKVAETLLRRSAGGRAS